MKPPAFIILLVFVLTLAAASLYSHVTAPDRLLDTLASTPSTPLTALEDTPTLRNNIRSLAGFHVSFPARLDDFRVLTNNITVYNDGVVVYLLFSPAHNLSVVVSQKPSSVHSQLFTSLTELRSSHYSITTHPIDGVPWYVAVKRTHTYLTSTINGVDIGIGAFNVSSSTLIDIARSLE